MKNQIKHIKNVHKGIQTGRSFLANPMEFLVDRIIAFLVSILIPIPFVGELIVAFKYQVIALLIGLVLVVLGMVGLIGGILLDPTHLIPKFSFSTTPGGSTQSVPLEALAGYIESGFADTDTPSKSPFGGSGMEYTLITAGYHDLSYYQTYGLVHEGIDIVPTNAYYAQNKAYGLTHQVILFATISGSAHLYTDPYGALTVEITNSQGALKTVYKHMKQIIMCECQVHAGQPVGVMGATGFAFGEHTHYEVRLLQSGSWNTVNPADYIN